MTVPKKFQTTRRILFSQINFFKNYVQSVLEKKSNNLEVIQIFWLFVNIYKVESVNLGE